MSIMQMLLATSAGGETVDVAPLFSAYAYSGSGDTTRYRNSIDFVNNEGLMWVKCRSHDNTRHTLCDTQRGIFQRISTDQAGPDTYDTSAAVAGFKVDGFVVKNSTETNASGFDYVAYSFIENEKFFDIVQWNGNSTNNRAISHSLGVTPEFIITKRLNASENWELTFDDLITNGEGFSSWGNVAKSSRSAWGASNPVNAPTSTTFSVSNNSSINGQGSNYIAYLFASLAGVSKVGTYTGSTSAVDVDCGFTNGAAFVMVKNTSTGHWFIWDSASGINSGNDPYVLAGSRNQEVTNKDYIDPLSSGFTATANDSSNQVNGNGITFYFLAIAVPNVSLASALRTTGSAIGNMTQDGGLAAAFDDSTTGNFQSGARKDPSSNCHIGRNFGSSKTLRGIKLFRPDGSGTGGSNCFPGEGGGTYTVQKSSNGSTWTEVTAVAGTVEKSILITFPETSSQYWRVLFSGDGNGGTVQEMQFFT